MADIDGPHHVWLTSAEPGEPLAYVIARDEHILLRHAVATRLDRRLAGAPPARTNRINRPTSYQQRRLRLLLSILDLKAEKGAERVPTFHVARTLIYPHSEFRNNAEWKSSSERRQTQRLIEEAKFLMHRGYRSLLCGITSVRQK